MGSLQRRYVSGKDPRTVHPFRESAYKYEEEHAIYTRSLSLTPLMTQTLDKKGKERLLKTMDGIDNDISRGLLGAQKKCKPNFQDDWTPKIDAAAQKVQYFQLWKSEYKTKRNHQ